MKDNEMGIGLINEKKRIKTIKKHLAIKKGNLK